MFKLTTAQKLYVGAMAATFVALDLAGVSNGDKLALSALFGVIAPVCFPKITKQIFLISARKN